jgi:hypothetical protein
MLYLEFFFLLTVSTCCYSIVGQFLTPLIAHNTRSPDCHIISLHVLQPIRYGKTASLLRVAYFEDGLHDAQVVILTHGSPYGINSIAPRLPERGYRVVVPHLRDNGDTVFINEPTPRSAEQAALGYDLLTLLDALKIEHAILAGCGWG